VGGQGGEGGADVPDSTVKVIMTQDAASRKVADFWQNSSTKAAFPSTRATPRRCTNR